MSKPDQAATLGHVTRRDLLKTAGAGLAGASLLTMLEAKQAPAQIRGTSLRILQWSHFVPAYDVWFDKFAEEWGNKAGVKVRVDRIPHLEIPSRLAAEFAAGRGHDLIYFVGTILTALYHKNLEDVSDIAERIGTKWGGWIPSAVPISVVEGRWHALPDFYIVAPLIWRKDLFDQQGLAAPDTWELARVAARTLKPKGHPTGIAFSHCNDANLFLRAIVFSHGGQEADPSGQNILIDSKETREGLRFLKALYEDGMTPEVFSWDDASDNRYLASGVACWIHDAISAYRSTEDTNPRVFQNTHLALEPQGLPSKRVSIANPNAYAMWKFAKNVPAAKEFLIHLADNWKDSMIGSRGYNMPFLKDAYRKPMPVIGSDPKLQILQDFPDIVAFAGHPGAFTPAIQELVATFVFPDMCTRVVKGQSPDEAIKWAVGEYRRVYARYQRGEVALLIATARLYHEARPQRRSFYRASCGEKELPGLAEVPRDSLTTVPWLDSLDAIGSKPTATEKGKGGELMPAKVKPIPDGYHTITPYLSIRGAADAIDFYQRAFGATEVMRMAKPDGRVGHAELQLGESRVMLADEFPEMDFRSPQSIGGTPVHLHMYVENVDAVVNQAIAAGAKLLRPVQDQFYGDRLGTVSDPYGHVWHVSTHKEDLSMEELRKRAASQPEG